MSEGQSFVRFNPPPGWPLTASSQLPPEHWSPPADWATPPAGWAFYVDGANRAVPAPLGAWQPAAPATQQLPVQPPWPTPAAPAAPGAPGAPAGDPWATAPQTGWAPTQAGGWQPSAPAQGGWQPPTPPRRNVVPIIIAAGLALALLAGGFGLWLRSRNDGQGIATGPTSTAGSTPVTPAPTTPSPTRTTGRSSGGSSTDPGSPSSPAGAGTDTPAGASGGPALTEAQFRSMLAGHKLGGVDGIYSPRKPNWVPKPTSVEASLPACVTYTGFEAANNTLVAQDTDATSTPSVFVYLYTSVQAKRDQIPLDMACGTALAGKGVLSWVYQARTTMGPVDVISWDSDGQRITEYHYGNLRVGRVGDPSSSFASALVAQIDAAATKTV